MRWSLASVYHVPHMHWLISMWPLTPWCTADLYFSNFNSCVPLHETDF